MRELTGILILMTSLSGCVITASSGTRTEYEDKIMKIEKDYMDMKITKAEYDELKDRADQQARVSQKNSTISTSDIYP